MSFLLFNAYNYRNISKYKIKDVRVNYIGEAYRVSSCESLMRVFKIEDPIVKTLKFTCIIDVCDPNRIERANDGEYFINVKLIKEVWRQSLSIVQSCIMLLMMNS